MAERAPFGRGRLRRLFGLDRSGAKPQPDPHRGAAAALDAPQPGRLRAARGVAALPLPRLRIWQRAQRRRRDRLLADRRGRLSSTASSPASPASTAAWGRCWTRLSTDSPILSGAVVCWSFELLPRWALALLALREMAMLVLAKYGLRHGVDIEVNWPGRASVFPIMGGIFLAMIFAGWVPAALLICRAGARDSSRRSSTPRPG